jgi:DNA polymerase-4
MASIIVCVDMDAFFASVEQRDNPALRGKPIAVTGAGERAVITTSSYEARAYGVKTGMTVYEAKRLCPHIILVVGNNQRYAQICTRLQEICLRFTPDTECYSIDVASGESGQFASSESWWSKFKCLSI